MPSYFFHIKLDLIHPKQDLGSVLQKDSKLLDYCKTSSQDLVKEADTSLTYDQPTGIQEGESDWRVGNIFYQSVDMLSPSSDDSRYSSGGTIRTGLSSIYPGLATKARFEPSDTAEEELGYGVVRLFRDTDETPGLYDLLSNTKTTKATKKHGKKSGQIEPQNKKPAFVDEECTTLAILTVPSWWDVARLMAFVGEQARDDVSHFRMIRTEPPGQYMLLMQFRNGKTARDWRKEWNGKVFDPAAPTEYCHVVFIRSVEVREINDTAESNGHSEDPFIDGLTGREITKARPLPSIATLGSKPLPPPTRPLKEFPTCPVCLERMDESSGLLTIPCQHTFHCVCLVKWRKNGCPICRFTQDDVVRRGSDGLDKESLNECSICRTDENLWMCLICGNQGCGRYDGAHAYLHWKQTGHSFSLDLKDQSIWDYASDAYVHRIMQNKIDGKMMELPATAADYNNENGEEDVVPRSKFEAMGAEYTHLLTSQLESQRTYYEHKLDAAADKAAEKDRNIAQQEEDLAKAVKNLSILEAERDLAIKETIPSLTKDKDRAVRRAAKFEEMSRKMEKAWREEQSMAGSSREKINWQEKEFKRLQDEAEQMAIRISDLTEQNNDLMGFLSSQDKIKDNPDIQGGTLMILNPKDVEDEDEEAKPAEKKKRRKPKNRGKGGRGEALLTLGKNSTTTSGENSKNVSDNEADEKNDAEDADTEVRRSREVVKIHSPAKPESKSEHNVPA